MTNWASGPQVLRVVKHSFHTCIFCVWIVFVFKIAADNVTLQTYLGRKLKEQTCSVWNVPQREGSCTWLTSVQEEEDVSCWEQWQSVVSLVSQIIQKRGYGWMFLGLGSWAWVEMISSAGCHHIHVTALWKDCNDTSFFKNDWLHLSIYLRNVSLNAPSKCIIPSLGTILYVSIQEIKF